MYEFIEAIPSEFEPGMWWAVVEGPGGPEIIDDVYETREAAEKAGREFKRDLEQAEWEARHEQAWEEGMLQGLDAYNEIMGYD